jgi:fermentation-respiration switch protein FrsA (DUF1100 family)
MEVYLKIFIWIVILFLLFPLLVFFLYLRPPKYISDTNPEKFNLEYKKISFQTKDGLTLRGWFIPSNYSNATIIIGHGFPFDKGNILPVTKFLNKHYNLLYYDFRYFGESDGKITTIAYKEQDDLLQAIDYLKSREDIGKIGVMGFSLSAGNALLVNSQNLKAIVADSSFANLQELLKTVYWIFPWITKYPFMWVTSLYAKIFLRINLSKISPLENVKSITTPILFIHGSEDSQIPVKHSKMLHENAPNSELWIVEGADHGMSFSANPKLYEKKVMDFFDKQLL